MVVTADFRVDVRPYSGYSNPSLPIASWIAEGGVVGDASGGSVFMNFLFQPDGQANVSEMYNLEQLAMDSSGDATRQMTLQTLGMDQLSVNRPATDRRWMFEVDNVTQVAIGALNIRSTMLPLWLGAPNRDEGDAGLRFVTQNVDLLFLFVSIQGYMWGPRSVMAEGGPQRPVGSLFGP